MRALIVFALALSACDPGGGGVECTDEARSSVTVTLTDDGGQPVGDATLTFTVDGGAVQDCDNIMNDGTYVCGYEQAGVIAIHAVRGPSSADATATIGMTEDGCHVEGQSISMQLGPPECTDDTIRPSIEVTVAGSTGEELTGVTVEYGPSGGDDSQPCDAVGTDWVCGYEERGDFVVIAGASGHVTESVNVTVGFDGCHVVTEDVHFDLDWADD